MSLRGSAALRSVLALCLLTIVGAALTGCGGEDQQAVDNKLSGAGASFPDPVYQQMFRSYYEKTGAQVNYDPVGSGGGRYEFISDTADFGGSDAPMNSSEEQEAGGDPQHLPTVGGAVAISYNVPELEDEKPLKLTGKTVADIFLGDITSWNDPAIAKLNPEVRLPDEPITVVHRADGSGTTEILTTYLSEVSQSWASGPGASDEIDWPAGVGGEGNDGVSAQLQNTEYSIGYVGLEYAAGPTGLPYASIANTADGSFVRPTSETASNAIDAVSGEIPRDLKLILTEVTPYNGGEDIYPITGLTWLLVRSAQQELDTCRGVANVAWYMTHEGQKAAPEQNYAALPEALVEANERKIEQLRAEGERCYQSQ